MPVVTFRTGGAIEGIDASCGIAVEKNDIEELVKVLEGDLWEKLDKAACRRRAEQFEAEMAYQKYVELMQNFVEQEPGQSGR